MRQRRIPLTAYFHSVYVRNLEERVKPEPLKEALHALFSEYGNVVDIVAKRNLKAKGQAFVVFDTQEAALNAIEEVQGFELFDKPMHLALARTRSDITVQSTGNEEEFDLHKRRRMAEKGTPCFTYVYHFAGPALTDHFHFYIDKKKALEAAEEQKRLKRSMGEAQTDASGRPVKAARGAGLKATGQGPAAVIPDEYLPPNRILFVQNLPEGFGKDDLNNIFMRFDGFREVRTVPGRSGIAFVEYETEQGAIDAREQTTGMSLKDGEKTMKVTYQRQ